MVYTLYGFQRIDSFLHIQNIRIIVLDNTQSLPRNLHISEKSINKVHTSTRTGDKTN